MSDIILRIYSTTAAWADTLDHELSGEIKDYKIVDNCNYLIDTAWFRIDNSEHQYEDDIEVDDDSTTQVWRAHAMDGTLINSGVVTAVEKVGNSLIVKGKGMSELLSRKIIESESFYSKDGAGNAMQGKYILTDATYGLVKKYLSTTYGAINVLASGAGGYVDTPLTTQTLQDKIDGITLWDACILTAKASYGRTGQATNNCYDVYLFETYSGGSYSLNLWFREREVYPTSGITRFGPADIHLPDLRYSPSVLSKYNKVFVRGAINAMHKYPKDMDSITEGITNWTVTNGTMTPTTERIYGSWATGIIIGDGPPVTAEMEYDPRAAIVDNRYHTLNFYATASHLVDVNDRLEFSMGFEIKDKYGNNDWAYIPLTIFAHKLSLGISDGIYYPFSLSLPNRENDNGWSYSNGAFSGSGLPSKEWETINTIIFSFMPATANKDISYFYIDQLYFTGNVPYTGSATNGAPTYLKEYVHTDRGLHSDTICGNMAEQLLRAFKNTQYPAEISLLGYNRDFSLMAGENLELQVLDRGINVIAGQTPPKLPIQSITYTPGKQHIKLGRHISLAEVINEAKRSIRGIDKIQ